MNDINSIVDFKKYGKIKINLSEIMDKNGITRNKMCKLTGVKYDIVNRYYKAENIERIDLDFFARVCFVLNCDISEVLEYIKE